MNRQLHIDYHGKQLAPESMLPIENRPFVKAIGGLWTSTYDPELGSDWVQWCLAEHFNVPEKWDGYLLTPSTDARVLTIDSHEDLETVYDKYPLVMPELKSWNIQFVDYERLSKDYDAMHLTARGQAETRFSMPGLYGWDCESTHWFRWKFDKVEQVHGAMWK